MNQNPHPLVMQKRMWAVQIISPSRKVAFRQTATEAVAAGLSSLCISLSPEPWLLPRGARERPPGLWLQSAGREGVQHGALHPASGRGRARPQGRQDSRELASVCTLWFWLQTGTF